MKKRIHSNHVEMIKYFLKKIFNQTTSKAFGIDINLNCDSIQITTNETVKFSQLAELTDEINTISPNYYSVSCKRSGAGITVFVHPLEN